MRTDNNKEKGVWSDENQGFPWYMDVEYIDQQKADMAEKLDRALDLACTTKDYPELARWEDHYLFVYGTLKRNKSNHRVLQDKYVRYVADCYTTDAQYFLAQSRGGIPVLMGAWGKKDGTAKAVKGELYLVKTSKLIALDVFEQNDIIYKRIKIRVSVPIKPDLKSDPIDHVVPCWAYVGMKKAWSDETLSVCPSYERVQKSTGKKEPFYTYIGK